MIKKLKRQPSRHQKKEIKTRIYHSDIHGWNKKSVLTRVNDPYIKYIGKNMGAKTIKREWYLFDAEQKVLGRIATEIANLLRGKGKIAFEKNTDCGDYVVVLNAGKVVLTGNKENEKRYYKHTRYIGNLKTVEVKKLREDRPEEIIKHAVMGMLPKNKLQKLFISRLKIYKGETHPHQNIKFVNKD